MKFIVLWLIASFITFYTRFDTATSNTDINFWLGVFFTGLMWTIGISVALFVLLMIIAAIGALVEANR